MALMVLLAISIILQIVATVVAIRMIRVTKYNSAWILFTAAMLFITIQRIEELLYILSRHYEWNWHVKIMAYLGGWSGVIISICLAIGMLIVRRLFNYLALQERERRKSDQRILQAVIKAEERQKQRIAKELHDGLGPLLSTIKMSLSALRGSDEHQMKILENARGMINLSVKCLKEASNNLSPHILENLGLASGINIFIKGLDCVSQMDIEFTHNIHGRRFDLQVETVLYRAVLELLNNTIKHSSASRIRLSIRYENGCLQASYSDNGCGFNASNQSTGMGLSNIASRVESVNGRFELSSGIGDGVLAKILICDL